MSSRSRSRKSMSGSPSSQRSAGSIEILNKGKANGRVQFEVILPGASKPEWVLRTELIDMGHKSAVAQFDRELRAAVGTAASPALTSPGRARSRGRGRSRSPSASRSRGRSRSRSARRQRSASPARRSASRSRTPKRKLASASKKSATSPRRARSGGRKAGRTTPAKSTTPSRTRKAAADAAAASAAKKKQAASPKTPAKRAATPPQAAPAPSTARSSAPAPAAPGVPFSTFVFPEDVGVSQAAMAASAQGMLHSGLGWARSILAAVAVAHTVQGTSWAPEGSTTAWAADSILAAPWFLAATLCTAVGTLTAVRRHWPVAVHVEYARFAVLAMLIAAALGTEWVQLPRSLSTWLHLLSALPLLIAFRLALTVGPKESTGTWPKAAFASPAVEGAVGAIFAALLYACAGVEGSGIPADLAFTLPSTLPQAVELAATLLPLLALAMGVALAGKRASARGLAGAAGAAILLSGCLVCSTALQGRFLAYLDSKYIGALVAFLTALPPTWLTAAGVWCLGYSVLA